jgi:hypothetical protein
MQSILVAPKNLFQMIEKRITEQPDLLRIHHWHELPSGNEALVMDQIMEDDTAHCLVGWIVYFTPRAAEFERLRKDVDVYANEILVNSGRKPIPHAIFNSDEESVRKIVARRAEQERVEEALASQYNGVLN